MKNFSIVDGLLKEAVQILSPNFNDRPKLNTREEARKEREEGGEEEPEKEQIAPIDLLVIHNISLPPKQYGGGYVEQFFQNTLPIEEHEYFEEIKDMQVSAHLFITRLGDVMQFVNLNKRAWHAGLSVYQGRENCNDFSIGIELEGCDDENYTEEQYQILAAVSVAIADSYPDISVKSTCGHCDIAPGRKTDPGPFFNWQKYQQMWREANPQK